MKGLMKIVTTQLKTSGRLWNNVLNRILHQNTKRGQILRVLLIPQVRVA